MSGERPREYYCPISGGMTPWLVQIEGRGNGIKTNVVNNVEIAKALERPPDCESLQPAAQKWATCAHTVCIVVSRFFRETDSPIFDARLKICLCQRRHCQILRMRAGCTDKV